MGWTLTADVEEFLARAGGLLRARPAANTIILCATETLRACGAAAFGDHAPLFGWWAEPTSRAGAAFMHTPPFPVVLAGVTAAAAAPLADALAERGRFPAGVNAERPVSEAFAAAWQARTGQAGSTQLRSRLYRLAALVPPSPVPPGAARVAGPGDRDLLMSWLDAFMAEAGERAHDTGRAVADRLSYGGLTLWETGDGPVSMGGVTRPAAGQIRIGPVYTPPALRGRGFGGAVTTAVTRAALAAGTEEVLLYADLANPTSNALYQRLGFQPVSDWLMITFTR